MHLRQCSKDKFSGRACPRTPLGELRKLENGPETPDDNTSNRKYFHVMCGRQKKSSQSVSKAFSEEKNKCEGRFVFIVSEFFLFSSR